jgi:hypothetical protein
MKILAIILLIYSDFCFGAFSYGELEEDEVFTEKDEIKLEKEYQINKENPLRVELSELGLVSFLDRVETVSCERFKPLSLNYLGQQGEEKRFFGIYKDHMWQGLAALIQLGLISQVFSLFCLEDTCPPGYLYAGSSKCQSEDSSNLSLTSHRKQDWGCYGGVTGGLMAVPALYLIGANLYYVYQYGKLKFTKEKEPDEENPSPGILDTFYDHFLRVKEEHGENLPLQITKTEPYGGLLLDFDSIQDRDMFLMSYMNGGESSEDE